MYFLIHSLLGSKVLSTITDTFSTVKNWLHELSDIIRNFLITFSLIYILLVEKSFSSVSFSSYLFTTYKVTGAVLADGRHWDTQFMSTQRACIHSCSGWVCTHVNSQVTLSNSFPFYEPQFSHLGNGENLLEYHADVPMIHQADWWERTCQVLAWDPRKYGF